MKKNCFFTLLVVSALVMGVLACNYPFISSPTPIVFPTPDLTMTAVFNPTVTSQSVIFPTQTSLPAWVSPTSTPVGLLPSSTPTNTPLPPTSTPTKTATPTRSYAGPAMRPKFSMIGYYFGTAPTIDASLEDWDLDRYRIENVVYGKSNHSGEDDLSGRAMVGWDEKNLYLGIRVIDDKYVQKARGSNLFMGDSLDILLDTDVPSDYYLGALNGDDYQLGISPGSPLIKENLEAYLWHPKSIEGGQENDTIGSRTREDGYVVEAAIPWSVYEVYP